MSLTRATLAHPFVSANVPSETSFVVMRLLHVLFLTSQFFTVTILARRVLLELIYRRLALKRFGKVLRLREGAESDYERMHQNVWPDVLQAINQADISSFTIFRYGRWLFCYLEMPDDVSPEKASRQIASNPAAVEWESLMHKLQEPLPESTGLNWWVDMKEIFHIGD